jgi:hypothetical protein
MDIHSVDFHHDQFVHCACLPFRIH